jgi:hypothetical protein
MTAGPIMRISPEDLEAKPVRRALPCAAVPSVAEQVQAAIAAERRVLVEAIGEAMGASMAELRADIAAAREAGLADSRRIEARIAALEAQVEARKYTGIFRAGEVYQPGNICTADGARWIAHVVTTAKPGSNGHWTLIEKSNPPPRKPTHMNGSRPRNTA